jgi:hypothetical protein
LIAYVWHVNDPVKSRTYAMTYKQAKKLMVAMRYTQTESWRRGNYVTTRPSVDLQERLEPYAMTAAKWQRVFGGAE